MSIHIDLSTLIKYSYFEIGLVNRLFKLQNHLNQADQSFSIQLNCTSRLFTQNRLISLHSQAQALVNSIAEESKTVQLLEREVRERRKKLRMTVTNEPCPHLRQASSRDDERDPLGSLACNLRCLLM